MLKTPDLLWEDPVWQKDAHAWIHQIAEEHDIQLIDEIEQPHIRHWSTVMSVEADQGKLFFKATAPETQHEIALTEKLAEWSPADTPKLLGIDVERGWMIMRNGGEQLRASIRPTKNIQPWAPVISRYADLQIKLAPYLEEMLKLGLPDHRLAALPICFSELLDDEESLLLGREKGLSADELQRCRELQPRFEEICVDLAGYGIPESINHGDFHDGNVLIRDGQITFFDWGDADLTHPFLSLRTFFISIEIALELDDYAFTPQMADLLDIYLARFKSYGSLPELKKAFELSKPAASLVTALKWRESISKMNQTMHAEHAWIVPEVLREFLYQMDSIGKQV